jgi:spore coat polysaccharide biosynthesis protein SpsF
VDESCAALGRSRLDVVLLHRMAHRHVLDGSVWRTLRTLREQGVIGALGVSAASPDDALLAVDDPEVEAIQVAYSLFDRRLDSTSFFVHATRRGVKVAIRSVLLQGALLASSRALPAHLSVLEPSLRALDQWAGDHGLDRRQALLAFARSRAPGPLVVGTETLGQLQATLGTWQRPLLDGAQQQELVDLIPIHRDEVLDPSCWPSA